MSSETCELLCIDLPQAEKVRARVPVDDDVRSAADRARALGDPTRLRIARALQVGGELCVCDLAWVCSSSQNLVSHHARQLRTAGLAASRRDGKLVMYRLTDAGHALLSLLLPDPDLESAVSEG
jgi:DNA-binding transcriptional ArsR family regulator